MLHSVGLCFKLFDFGQNLRNIYSCCHRLATYRQHCFSQACTHLVLKTKMADFGDLDETYDKKMDDEVVHNEENNTKQHKAGKKTLATVKRKKTTKKWTTEDSNQLIDLFEKHPCLWDIYTAVRKKRLHTMR